jgi:ubiquinone biosynthesis protein
MQKFARLLCILKIFCRYRLEELLPKLHPSKKFLAVKWLCKLCFFWRLGQPKRPLPERTRLALQALGPIYVKVGQLLSTRRDLLGPEWSAQLAQLQDQVAPIAEAEAVALIEKELGRPIAEVFTEFEPKPLASASIAQVHCARVKTTNQRVVLKVLRPNLKQAIAADLDLMFWIIARLEAYAPKLKKIRLHDVLKDYQTTLYNELNLELEAQNTLRLKANFEQSELLYIPAIETQWSTSKLLIVEYVDGIRVDDLDALKAHRIDLKKLSKRGVEIFFKQVFEDNFFHADMHPGNIFVAKETPDNPQYIGIDCGIIGTLSEQDKQWVAQCFLAFFRQRHQDLAKLFIHSGWVSSSTEHAEFEKALASICEPLFEKPLAEISLGHFMMTLFDMARQYDFTVQPQLVLLQKTLLYVEGLGRTIDPQLDLWQTAKPFLETWMKAHMGPRSTFKKTKELMPKLLENLPDIPELVYDNLQAGRHMLHSQQKMLAQYVLEQRHHQKQQHWLITAGILFLGGLVVGLNTAWPLWGSWSLCLVGLGLWIKSWRMSVGVLKT